ncbi:hypothetical protein D3C84_1106520 [compost metagenome]
MGDQEGAYRHGDTADHAKDEHAQREHGQAFANHQPGDSQHHQHKAEHQLTFQRDDFHQPGIEEDRNQNTGVKKGKGIAHAGNRQIKVLCNVPHHHPCDDN